MRTKCLARLFHELLSRDREGGCATEQPQTVGSEAYLSVTSQGELVLGLSKEHPKTPGRTAILFALAPLRPASGFPVSLSQQVIHETSGLVVAKILPRRQSPYEVVLD